MNLPHPIPFRTVETAERALPPLHTEKKNKTPHAPLDFKKKKKITIPLNIHPSLSAHIRDPDLGIRKPPAIPFLLILPILLLLSPAVSLFLSGGGGGGGGAHEP